MAALGEPIGPTSLLLNFLNSLPPEYNPEKAFLRGDRRLNHADKERSVSQRYEQILEEANLSTETALSAKQGGKGNSVSGSAG